MNIHIDDDGGVAGAARRLAADKLEESELGVAIGRAERLAGRLAGEPGALGELRELLQPIFLATAPPALTWSEELALAGDGCRRWSVAEAILSWLPLLLSLLIGMLLASRRVAYDDWLVLGPLAALAVSAMCGALVCRFIVGRRRLQAKKAYLLALESLCNDRTRFLRGDP